VQKTGNEELWTRGFSLRQMIKLSS